MSQAVGVCEQAKTREVAFVIASTNLAAITYAFMC